MSSDGAFVVDYRGVSDLINMYGDSIISHDEGTLVAGLELNRFRTFRFETVSEQTYCFWFDGLLFFCDQHTNAKTGIDYIQMFGRGGVDANQEPGPIVNRWDYVRYGRVTTGETIVASDPPSGVLNADLHPDLDHFTVTFDQPNYVYVADVTVEVLV